MTFSEKFPFFIIGCGRSGTTLLRAMLNNHPLIYIPLESLFITDYLRSEKNIEILKRMIVNEYELSEWGLTLTYKDVEDCKNKKDLIDRLHNIQMQKSGKKIWGQKTPRFIRYGNLLKQYYPTAKFIHLIRDPRAVVNSLINSNVHRSNPYFASKRWVNDTQQGLKLKEQYPNDVLEVRYEALVTNPEKQLEKICRFLNIPFDRNMLDYHKSQSEYGVYYKKIHARIQETPNPERIDSWKKSLKKRNLSLIESVCKRTMEETHYALEAEALKISRIYRFYLIINRWLLLPLQFSHYFLTRRKYVFSFIKRKFSLHLLKDFSDINY